MFLRLDLQAAAGAGAEDSVAEATGAGLGESSHTAKDECSVPWVPKEPDNMDKQEVQEVQACVVQGGGGEEAGAHVSEAAEQAQQ